MRSASSSDRAPVKLTLLALAFALAAQGCSTSAPSLPPDTTSVNRTRTLSIDEFSAPDRAMSCQQVADEDGKIMHDMTVAESAIKSARVGNQAALYLSSFFLLPALAVRTHESEKDLLQRAPGRRDTLRNLARVKGCPPLA